MSGAACRPAAILALAAALAVGQAAAARADAPLRFAPEPVDDRADGYRSGFHDDLGTILGTIAVGAVIGGILGILNDRKGSSSSSGDRRGTAIELCVAHADRLVREAGGRGARLAKVRDVDQRNDRARVRAEVELRGRHGAHDRARIDCTVRFDGPNRVVAFDHDGRLRHAVYRPDRRHPQPPGRPRAEPKPWSHGHGPARGLEARARAACTAAAERRGREVRRVTVTSRERDGLVVTLLVDGRRQPARLDCRYDPRSRTARLDDGRRWASRD
jgi:hypothetical protein